MFATIAEYHFPLRTTVWWINIWIRCLTLKYAELMMLDTVGVWCKITNSCSMHTLLCSCNKFKLLDRNLMWKSWSRCIQECMADDCSYVSIFHHENILDKKNIIFFLHHKLPMTQSDVAISDDRMQTWKIHDFIQKQIHWMSSFWVELLCSSYEHSN